MKKYGQYFPSLEFMIMGGNEILFLWCYGWLDADAISKFHQNSVYKWGEGLLISNLIWVIMFWDKMFTEIFVYFNSLIWR